MSDPRLLITRPADECERTADAVRAAGFTPVLAPLLTIETLDFALPLTQPDAILFTSPRAPAILASVAPELLGCTAYSVGPRTTEAATAAGFRIQGEGQGDGNEALRLAGARHRHILQPRGADHIDLVVPDGVFLHPVSVYRAKEVLRLPADIVEQLAAGDILATMLFSPRTARIFAARVADAGLLRSTMSLLTLSAHVADAAGHGWRAVERADAPRLDETLAAARRLWQRISDA